MIYELTGRGLSPINSSILLQENTPYRMGASSSPKMIFVTEVNGENFKYLVYPWTGPALNGNRIEKSLIRRGTAQWVTNLKAYIKSWGPSDNVFASELESYEKLLAGKPAPELVEDPAGLVYGYVMVAPGMGPHHRGGSSYPHWYSCERYGNVSGTEIGGIEYCEIHCQAKMIPLIESDPSLRIVNDPLGSYEGPLHSKRYYERANPEAS